MGVLVDGKGSGSCPEEKLGVWFPKAINPLELICKNKRECTFFNHVRRKQTS